jgi:hypothetical protein
MVYVPVTVLGGLPVIAEVWFSGPDYFGEYDAGVDSLSWQKHDGSIGSPLSEKVMARIEKDPYWQAYVTEQANDWLSVHAPHKHHDGTLEGDWSEEYKRLNPETKRATQAPVD